MSGHGCDRILIDGALDRRAAAAPSVSNGIVLSTGAVLSKDLEEIVSQTRYAIQRIGLGAFGGAAPSELGVSVLRDTEGVDHALDTTLGSGPALRAVAARGLQPATIFAGGALTDVFVEEVLSLFPDARPVLVVRDFTRLFVAPRLWKRCLRRGLSLAALEPAHLVAVTVNPVAPCSHTFPSALLRERLEEVCGGVRVLDVVANHEA